MNNHHMNTILSASQLALGTRAHLLKIPNTECSFRVYLPFWDSLQIKSFSQLAITYVSMFSYNGNIPIMRIVNKVIIKQND
jgi:hypothetical protein